MRVLELCAACENAEHVKCIDADWRPGDLRYCSCQGQCLPTAELGRRVERGLFRENTRGMNTMRDLFWQRQFKQQEEVRTWERWNAHRHATEPAYALGWRKAGPNPHGIECPCDRCHQGVLRLLRDCGVLPRGEPEWTGFDVYPDEQPFVPTRYRRDESDR